SNTKRESELQGTFTACGKADPRKATIRTFIFGDVRRSGVALRPLGPRRSPWSRSAGGARFTPITFVSLIPFISFLTFDTLFTYWPLRPRVTFFATSGTKAH